MKKLEKKVRKLRDEAARSRDRMMDTGEWLPFSEFSELDGKIDALDAVLLLIKEASGEKEPSSKKEKVAEKQEKREANEKTEQL